MVVGGGSDAIHLGSGNFVGEPVWRLPRSNSFLYFLHVPAWLHALSAADHSDLLSLYLCERNYGGAYASLLDKHGGRSHNHSGRCSFDHSRARMVFAQRGGAVSERVHALLLVCGNLVDSAFTYSGILASRL